MLVTELGQMEKSLVRPILSRGELTETLGLTLSASQPSLVILEVQQDFQAKEPERCHIEIEKI